MKFFEIIPNDVHIDFLKYRKVAAVFSSLLVIASLVSIFVVGFNWGIDFAGGLEMRIEFLGQAKAVDIGQVRSMMNKLPDDMPLSGVQVTKFIMPDRNVMTIKAKGEENVAKAGGDTALQDLSAKLYYFLASFYAKQIKINFELIDPKGEPSLTDIQQVVNTAVTGLPITDLKVEQGEKANQYILTAKPGMGNEEQVRFAIYRLPIELPQKLNAQYGENTTNLESVGYGEEAVNIVSTDMVGPRVGAALRKKGLNSIIYALIGIMIYVGYRFNFRYSPGGVVALAHDVIITAGIFSFFHREINLVIVAALLTIAGYSINDTIVIFDRIREGRDTTYRRLSLYDSVNRSLNETLSRTLLTVGTTLFVVVALLLLGGEILFDFALAMLIGFTIGTYSSLFIATPIYIWLEEWFVNRRKAKAKGAVSR